VDTLVPMIHYSQQHRCEKNWIPFRAEDGRYHFIYNHNPLTMLEARPINAWLEGSDTSMNGSKQVACYPSLKLTSEFNLREHRGSSCAISYKWRDAETERDIYLICTHSVIIDDRRRRYYYSTLLGYDSEWKLVGLSRPFNLIHTGIEYCAGLVESHDGEHIIFTIGVEDREGYLVKVRREVIDQIVRPVDRFRITIG
jgi:hypothetical protein